MFIIYKITKKLSKNINCLIFQQHLITKEATGENNPIINKKKHCLYNKNSCILYVRMKRVLTDEFVRGVQLHGYTSTHTEISLCL